MNDRSKGGMTISALLTLGFIVSVAIPIICLVVLGMTSSKTATPLALVAILIAVTLLGGALIHYMVRRRVLDRLLSLADVSRSFVGGDR